MKADIKILLAGVVVAFVLVFGSDLLSVVSEKRLIVYYNPKDDSSTFNIGDPFAVDTTFVQWDLDRRYNNEADRNQKQGYIRHVDGWIILVDGKIYDRKVGAATQYGLESCGRICDHREKWWLGLGPSECVGADGDPRNSCVSIYSDDYLIKQNIPVVVMTDFEKASLAGCHTVDARVARVEHFNLQPSGPWFAVEHTSRMERVCWNGGETTNPLPTTEVTPKIPIIQNGGGCPAKNL